MPSGLISIEPGGFSFGGGQTGPVVSGTTAVVSSGGNALGSGTDSQVTYLQRIARTVARSRIPAPSRVSRRIFWD